MNSLQGGTENMTYGSWSLINGILAEKGILSTRPFESQLTAEGSDAHL
jgi:hypothetical protein